MKKIIASVVTIIMVLTICTTAFAEAPNTNSGNGIRDTVQDARTNAQDYKPLLDQIRENRKTMKSQEQEIRKLTQQIRGITKEMIKNGEAPDEATINKLDELLDEMNSHRQELAGTLGKIRVEELKMLQNRKNKDWDAYEENLNNIIEIQNKRMAEQEQIIDGLNDMLSELETV